MKVIIDMEKMPECCVCCDLITHFTYSLNCSDSWNCPYINEDLDSDEARQKYNFCEERHPDCPLKPYVEESEMVKILDEKLGELMRAMLQIQDISKIVGRLETL